MKKLMMFAFLACVITAFGFAESFTVQNVTGRVEQELNGQRVALKGGEILSGEAVIHTGIGASVVFTDGREKAITIPSARNGKVAELVKTVAGVRIGGNVTRTDTGTVNRTTAQIGTASARASDAAGELDVAAE